MPIHSAPAADCVCGIYGAALATQARPFLWMPGRDQAAYRVVGRVSLWGRMVQAQRGWRAELGYPERIYVPATSGSRGGGGVGAGSEHRTSPALCTPMVFQSR